MFSKDSPPSECDLSTLDAFDADDLTRHVTSLTFPGADGEPTSFLSSRYLASAPLQADPLLNAISGVADIQASPSIAGSTRFKFPGMRLSIENAGPLIASPSIEPDNLFQS